jgi:hypothetical protein
MGILIAGVIIVVGYISSMTLLKASKKEQKFIEWVNK